MCIYKTYILKPFCYVNKKWHVNCKYNFHKILKTDLNDQRKIKEVIMYSILKPMSYPSIIDEFFGEMEKRNESRMPSVDIYEKENKYFVEAMLPGFTKEDINVDLNDDNLTISAEHKEETKENDKNYFRREIKTNSFSRSFTLSNDIDKENIEAKYENGILKLQFNKLEIPEKKTQKIEIA